MDPLLRSPYDMGFTDFEGQGEQRSKIEGAFDDSKAASLRSRSNAISSGTESLYTGDNIESNVDQYDDDYERVADSSIDGFLIDEEDEESPGVLKRAGGLLTTPIREFFDGWDWTMSWNTIGQIALGILALLFLYYIQKQGTKDKEIRRPDYTNHRPYISSSYYTSTKSLKTLQEIERLQVRRLSSKKPLLEKNFSSRLAIVRPFCEFDAEALPTTFAVWNQLAPCRASATDLDLNGGSTRNKTDNPDRYFDDVTSEIMHDMVADVFLFYSQTFSDNDVAIKSIDTIINQFNEPHGWSQCFANIYAIEANIPQELDLYIPSAQEELYNWVCFY
mmetsp:Transcript_18829/g.20980  ORF Transcript_18829/g.20980 Transcript_18829/m.20980 type:complete len:333 (+) Transcript_18829:82-1080(+)